MLIIKLLSISYLFWVGITNAQLQNEDFATTSQMEARGLTAPQAKQAMLHDSKIYVTADGINKLLVDAIEDGDIGGYLSPTTTEGDLILRGVSQDERLPIGSNGHVLTSNGTTAVWQALPPSTGLPTDATQVADWNDADVNGFFQGQPGTPNAPTSDRWYIGFAVRHNERWITQEVWDFANGGSNASLQSRWKRQSADIGGVRTWGAWYRSARVQVTDYTSGSGTYFVPAGTYALFVESLGGGGGGGRSSSQNAAGGGGGGGYSYLYITSSIATSYVYSVGSGGAGRTGSLGNGSAGGSSNCAGVIAGGGGGGTGDNNVFQPSGVGGSGNVVGAVGGGGSRTPTGGSNDLLKGGFGGAGASIGGGGGREVRGSAGESSAAGTGGGGSGGSSGNNGGNGGSGRCKFTAYIAN